MVVLATTVVPEERRRFIVAVAVAVAVAVGVGVGVAEGRGVLP